MHESIAAKTVELARRHKKIPPRWVMSYFESPRDLNFLKEVVRAYAHAGVESVFSWTYRAGQGTILSAPEPQKAWDIIGDAYKEFLNYEISIHRSPPLTVWGGPEDLTPMIQGLNAAGRCEHAQ